MRKFLYTHNVPKPGQKPINPEPGKDNPVNPQEDFPGKNGNKSG